MATTYEYFKINDHKVQVDSAIRDGNGKTISTHYATKSENSGKLDKITYEWNQAINFGSSGYLKIGTFPMYDSNITIDINSTTSTTYHGIVVIATQNVSTTSIGSAHVVNVYGDASDTITSAIRVTWASGSNAYNVYFVPQSWSKNIIHIKASALAGAASDVCISQEGTAPSSTSGLEAVNVLRNTYQLIINASNKLSYDYLSDVPTKLSQFTDDLGSSPTHTHGQYAVLNQANTFVGTQTIKGKFYVYQDSGTVLEIDTGPTPPIVNFSVRPTYNNSTKFAFMSDLTWSNISNKPSTFTPSAHTHGNSDLTELAAWAKAATKPSYTYTEVGAAASDHTHSEYVDLSSAQTITGSKTFMGTIDFFTGSGYIYGSTGDFYLKSENQMYLINNNGTDPNPQSLNIKNFTLKMFKGSTEKASLTNAGIFKCQSLTDGTTTKTMTELLAGINPSNMVTTDTDQTITGIKTFSNHIILGSYIGDGSNQFNLPSQSGRLVVDTQLPNVSYSGSTLSGGSILASIQIGDDKWNIPLGTVTSVRVQAGTGLSSSQSSAQTGTLNTTISIASGYKLPTTTEWNNKASTDVATTSANGLMSSSDKTKLNGIATGATKVIESTVSDWGFTKNTGTVTQVKVGTTTYDPSSGVISLPAYPTTLPASDVYAWAKAATKPSYSWSEITSKPSTFTPSSHTHTNSDLTGLADWAKAATKPSYSWSEIGSKPNVAIKDSDNAFSGSNTFTGTVSFRGDTYFTGFFKVYGDDGFDEHQPDDVVSDQHDMDAYYYNTGITYHDCDTSTDYKYSFPGKSGTFAMYSDIAWANIANKPSTFTPSSHTHGNSDLTGLAEWAKAATKPSYSWSEITSKPSTFTPSSHTHTNSDLTGLADWAKAATKPSYSWSEITSKPSTFTPSSHTHGNSDLTGLAEWAKAATKPAYIWSEIGSRPTKLSQFTDDLGTSPTHTHSQYLTSHQDISGKANLSGATFTGQVICSNSAFGQSLQVLRTAAGNPAIDLRNNTGNCQGYIGIETANNKWYTSVNGGDQKYIAYTSDIPDISGKQNKAPTITIAATQIKTISGTSIRYIEPTSAQQTIVETLDNTIIKVDLTAVYSALGIDSPYAWLVRNATKYIPDPNYPTDTSKVSTCYEFICYSNDLDLGNTLKKLGNLSFYYFYDAKGTISSYGLSKKILPELGKITLANLSHATNIENGGMAAIQQSPNGTFSATPRNYSFSGLAAGAPANYSAMFNGNSKAEGTYSAAFGLYTYALGYGAFTMGDETYAPGDFAFAGGQKCSSVGNISFTYGQGLIASGDVQAVFGKYNVSDTSKLFIIGKGDSTTPSNAFTVDRNGFATVAGQITVGSAPTDNMHTATKQYVDNAIASAITNVLNTAV